MTKLTYWRDKTHLSEMVMPGDTATMIVELGKPIAVDVGLGFAVREGGKTVAAGTITRLLD
jgi:elongation factor Tu